MVMPGMYPNRSSEKYTDLTKEALQKNGSFPCIMVITLMQLRQPKIWLKKPKHFYSELMKDALRPLFQKMYVLVHQE